MSNKIRIGRSPEICFESLTDEVEHSLDALRKKVEPWLSAVFQSEHLSLLAGSGFTLAVGNALRVGGTGMGWVELGDSKYGLTDFVKKVNDHANEVAHRCGRGRANIEDQIRTINQLIQGLRLTSDDDDGQQLMAWQSALAIILREFLESLLNTERELFGGFDAESNRNVDEEGEADGVDDNEVDEDPAAIGQAALSALTSFLLSFSARAASRERLHIFTTNYDRLIEFGCDHAGIRLIDRFVGSLTPVFRSSRLDVDFHYNPPGIRGEPRYLEGVVKITKLHGSLDWRFERSATYPHGVVRRYSIPFGAEASHTDFPANCEDSVMIYPQAAKDVETLEYPYADLFRDFAATLCRPNSVLVTYGYGFGDDHINRVIRDMLAIPSTHIVIISYDDASGRIPAFIDAIGNPAQVTLLQGPEVTNLLNLTNYLLPKPALDQIAFRETALLNRRTPYLHSPVDTDHDTTTGGA